jgi:hypothetical protein
MFAKTQGLGLELGNLCKHGQAHGRRKYCVLAGSGQPVSPTPKAHWSEDHGEVTIASRNNVGKAMVNCNRVILCVVKPW